MGIKPLRTLILGLSYVWFNEFRIAVAVYKLALAAAKINYRVNTFMLRSQSGKY